MDTKNEFPNDNDLVNPEDPYSPTEKEVREYVEMGYSRSGAISSLTTTKRNLAEQEDEWHPLDEDDMYAEKEEAKINPRVSMEEKMLTVNQYYRPSNKI